MTRSGGGSFSYGISRRRNFKARSPSSTVIAFQFLSLALLIAPPVLAFGAIDQHQIGAGGLMLAAALALVTLADYAARARTAFRDGG